MESLNHDVILKILSFMTTLDARGVSRVDKSWNTAVKDKVLNDALEDEGYDSQSDVMRMVEGRPSEHSDTDSDFCAGCDTEESDTDSNWCYDSEYQFSDYEGVHGYLSNEDDEPEAPRSPSMDML
eukprot:1547114-Prymnesium_polylepis.2